MPKITEFEKIHTAKGKRVKYSIVLRPNRSAHKICTPIQRHTFKTDKGLEEIWEAFWPKEEGPPHPFDDWKIHWNPIEASISNKAIEG